MENIRNKQHEAKIIKINGGIATIVSILALALGWIFLGDQHVELERATIYISLLAFPAIILVALVLNVGLRRLNADDATRDGGLTQKIRVHQSMLTNTIEQTLIFLLTTLPLVIVLPLNHLSMIYMVFILFILGRLTFIIGYLKFPIYRAFGFGLTFIPVIIYIIYILINITSNSGSTL